MITARMYLPSSTSIWILRSSFSSLLMANTSLTFDRIYSSRAHANATFRFTIGSSNREHTRRASLYRERAALLVPTLIPFGVQQIQRRGKNR